jgi:hypothetical protein
MKSMAQTPEEESVRLIFSSSTVGFDQAFACNKDEPPVYDEVLSRDVEIISTPTYSVKQQDSSNKDLICIKSYSAARCRGSIVSIVEYSGTYSRKKKHEVLFLLL